MIRTAAPAVLLLLLGGCGGSPRAADQTTPSTPSVPSSSATAPATVPESFPLSAGWGAGNADGRPHVVHRPLALDVHDIRPFEAAGAIARRTMVFDQPEWMRSREVDVFPTAAAATAVVAKAVRLARADRRGMAEDGSTYLRLVQLRRGGIVVVATWAELDGVPRVGTSTLVLHRSGRALLISTDSTEGLGRSAALREAAEDLRGLRPAIAALTNLG